MKVIGFLLLAYAAIACFVFEFRHPWMTDTEAFLNIGKALTFQTVSYEEMRPRTP